MAEPAKQADGESMEDILHSIRDIIADGPDTDKTKGNNDVSAQQGAQQAEEEVLELTEIVAETPETPMAESAPRATVGPAPQPATDDNKDILADIDSAVDVNSPQPEQPVQPTAAAPVQQPVQQEAVQVIEDKTPPQAEDQAPDAALIAENAAKATEGALKTLLQSVPKPKIESPEFRSGNTVEDLVLEALKPMLSEWLNKNLPVLVEQLVQKEIRKLVPRE